MRKLFLLSIIAISLMFTSCGPDPVKFNDSLVDYSDKAQTQIINLQTGLEAAFNSNDFKTVNDQSKVVLDSLNIYLTSVEKMEVPSDGAEFKSSVNDYLKALVEVTNTYSAYSKLNENSTEEEVLQLNNAADKAEDKASELFDALQGKQKEFASKHKMELR